MALFRKLFYRKPPDGLLEISERVYVFDCCFTTDAWEEESYKVYIGGIVGQLRDHFPDASVLVFNFREGETQGALADALSEHDMTIMDYPRHYETCPLLKMEMVHHFLRSSESWLSLGQNNLLLMHCERGGWPVLAFMLAALLIYRKQYSGEQKTLDMIYRQAPPELLHLLSPLNPIPSQLRYLQYVSRRNVASEWPPLDRALTLDCVILRFIPNFDGEGGCRPIFRIYGQDPFLVTDRTPKVLYSTPKKGKTIRAYKQADCELVKIDINCHIKGDVVLECISLNDDMEHEEMMFRVVFNTAFIRSNILMLNRDEIDMLWHAKDQFPKDFRVEIIFSEMDAAGSITSVDFSCFEEEGLPMEAFAKVHEIFNHVDWLDHRAEVALNVLQQISASNITQEKSDTDSHRNVEISPLLQETSPRKLQERKKLTVSENSLKSAMSLAPKIESLPSPKPSPDIGVSNEDAVPQDSLQSPSQSDVTHQQMLQSSHSTPVHHTSKQDLSTPPLPPLRPSLTSDAAKTPPPPPPSHYISASKPAHSSLVIETETYLQDRDQSSLASAPPAPETLFSGATSNALLSNPPPFPSPAIASLAPRLPPTPPPPPTPPLKEKSTVRAGPPPMPPPPPPPPPTPPLKEKSTVRAGPPPMPPPPPPPPTPPLKEKSTVRAGPPPTPPPPPPPPTPPLKEKSTVRAGPPPPPPPPLPSCQAASPAISSPVPPPPPPAPTLSSNSSHVPSAPPPPVGSRGDKSASGSPSPGPPPPFSPPTSVKGRNLSRTISSRSQQTKKLKPLHWLKLTRTVQGSLWAEAQKSGEASKAPEIDMSELESLFSAAIPTSDHGGKSSVRGSRGPKSEIVQLIDHRRAYNCEIMLSKVKVPLQDLMSSVLALEDSALDVDQVDNLIKFCPTKEEMELLKGYTGDKEKLGKCEQFFLELMKVPRVEAKLRVFSFKIQFRSQVSDLRSSLNIVNSAAEEIRNSVKLQRVMQTILSLGNALNQGTARGSAIGFRLDSLLKLTETRARNNKMTLMHYLCKVLADKLSGLLDFAKDLASLEPASKIQLKFLAEEMQAINKGLEKVVQELSISENDGLVSENFRKTLKEFLRFAEAEVRSLALLYSGVGRNVDALILYFGEDPVRCPFEQVVSTLLNFVRMFNKAHEENCKQLELETKKLAESEKSKLGTSHKESEHLLHSPIKSSNVK